MLCFLRALVYNSIRERLALYHTEAVKKRIFIGFALLTPVNFLINMLKKPQNGKNNCEVKNEKD